MELDQGVLDAIKSWGHPAPTDEQMAEVSRAVRADLATRKAIARLWDPGWLEIGTPDVSARIAERGAGYDVTDLYSVDEWDWQRHIPVRLISGTTRVYESPPNDAMHVLVPEQE